MVPEVFEACVHRVIELREQLGPQRHRPDVSFCGLGEQLLNPKTASFVHRLRTHDVAVAVNTNGAMLDERRARALLDADVSQVFVNGGELTDGYEQTYGMSFERVDENVTRFVELAGDRCAIYIVLVNHRRDLRHLSKVRRHWKSRGVTRFFQLDLLNRAGSLHYDDMAYESLGADIDERARALLDRTGHRHACRAPFDFPFIGYDGSYYLCSSDWQKEVAVGHVYEHSMMDIIGQKLEHVVTRDPICRSCNHDPLNKVKALLAEQAAGRATDDDLAQLLDELAEGAHRLDDTLGVLGADLDRLGTPLSEQSVVAAQPPRQLIPVHVS
jgi:MoaA/NifB/PqqE/SkfB family radical SAM enzyme